MASVLQHPDLDGSSFFWPAGEVGVLLLHGLTATTVEVRSIGKILHQNGYSVAGPLLPGHGTTPEELSRTTWQDWLSCARDAYQGLNLKCSTIFVGGESMGGLLALMLARQYPEIAGIMLYAPALHVRHLQWARWLALVRPYPPKRRGGGDMSWQGYQVNSLRAAAQLYRLQRQVLLRLPYIHTPALIVQGLLDQTIDPQSAQMVYDRIGSTRKELFWLEHSTHVLILDRELDLAARYTLDFLQNTL